MFNFTGALAVGLPAAVLFIAFGAGLFIELPKVVRRTINEDVRMVDPSSGLYPTFFDAPGHDVAVYKNTYFYNVTNAADVIAGNAYPIVRECGPYVYLERETRPENYTRWLPNATVSFKQHTVYEFQPKPSKGSDQDVILGINMKQKAPK